MFQRVSGTKLYEEVIRQIKDMIARGEYKQGDRLPSEKELVEMLGVSRITVREALRILSNMGIICTQKGKGSFVAVEGGQQTLRQIFSENLGDFKENFEYSCKTRMIIEPVIAAEAARLASEEDIRRLEALLESHHEDGLASVEMDEFHMCLLKIVDDRILLEMLEKLIALENTPMKVSMIKPEQKNQTVEAIERQHWQIFQAIKDHNPEFAYFYMKEHVAFLFQTYRDYFDCFFE